MTFEIIKKVLPVLDRHDESMETATKYAYRDKFGILHGTAYEDRASEAGDGVYAAVTGAIIEGGYFVVDGKRPKIKDATETTITYRTAVDAEHSNEPPYVERELRAVPQYAELAALYVALKAAY